MKVIRNNIIPFKGFKAVNLFGVLFVRKGSLIRDKDLNHEMIHTKQMRELLYVFFYIAYFFEWLLRLVFHRYEKSAYRSISFEKEAYDHEGDYSYLKVRKHYSMWRNTKN